ncbi:MAG: glycosyltransferase family 2 protein [Ruminococcaceae bacterium]|nr:glycosyltransferase family 2 protein [Oscillospiraceae bacterium]
MIFEQKEGVPRYECREYAPKNTKYCVLIPIINEGERIKRELERAKTAGVDKLCDIIICDGDSTDGSTADEIMQSLGVNTLLIKKSAGKQGAQLRMGIDFALNVRGYDGVVTIDGNDKDSIEDVPKFIEKLNEGYDLVQGSRFIKGGKAINTPFVRYVSVRLIHAPIISITAGQWFTDTTNAYRCYSAAYLRHPKVQPLREVFSGYELLAYLSVRATQLKMKACEVPVTRAYPKTGKTPTKISAVRGNSNLLKILFKNLFGGYNPSTDNGSERK